jgi:hypothetical protein
MEVLYYQKQSEKTDTTHDKSARSDLIFIFVSSGVLRTTRIVLWHNPVMLFFEQLLTIDWLYNVFWTPPGCIIISAAAPNCHL